MKYDFRECKYEDTDFILKLKRLGLKWYIEKIYGWDDQVQRDITRKELDKTIKDTRIIRVDNSDIGVTAFHKNKEYYCIGLTVIHPDYQNKVIATEILGKYINQAKVDKKRIIIKTYIYNPARKLYERLGFKAYDMDDTHVSMDIDFRNGGIL